MTAVVSHGVTPNAALGFHQCLFVLCGLPFSGKSTLARAMERRLEVVNVEVDRALVELDRFVNGQELTRNDWIAAYRTSFRRLEQALRDGSSVVFDATSYRKLQRQRLRRIAGTHGVPMTVIYLEVSEAEARRRLEANRRQPKRVNVPDEDFAMVVREFQPPGEDEEVFRYDGVVPIDVWIERVLIPHAVGLVTR